MLHTPRPWFRQQTGWWMVQLNHEKIKLAKGKGNRQEAERKLRELLQLRDPNPSLQAGFHTVASIIDLYLTHAKNVSSERSLYWRRASSLIQIVPLPSP